MPRRMQPHTRCRGWDFKFRQARNMIRCNASESIYVATRCRRNLILAALLAGVIASRQKPVHKVSWWNQLFSRNHQRTRFVLDFELCLRKRGFHLPKICVLVDEGGDAMMGLGKFPALMSVHCSWFEKEANVNCFYNSFIVSLIVKR